MAVELVRRALHQEWRGSASVALDNVAAIRATRLRVGSPGSHLVDKVHDGVEKMLAEVGGEVKFRVRWDLREL